MGKRDIRPSIKSRLHALVRPKYEAGNDNVSRLTDWFQSEMERRAERGEDWAVERDMVIRRDGYRRELVAILKELEQTEVTIYANGQVESKVEFSHNRGLVQRDNAGKIEAYTRPMILNTSRSEFFRIYRQDQEQYRRMGINMLIEDLIAKCFEIHPEAETVGDALRLSGFDTTALAIHRA